MRTTIPAMILMLCALLSPAHASNIGFLKDTPYFGHFTDEDRAIFHATLDELLKLGKAQDTRSWNNPKTGAKGELRLLPDPDDKSGCKLVEVHNTAGGKSGQGVHRFCPDASGVWKWQPVNPKTTGTNP